MPGLHHRQQIRPSAQSGTKFCFHTNFNGRDYANILCRYIPADWFVEFGSNTKTDFDFQFSNQMQSPLNISLCVLDSYLFSKPLNQKQQPNTKRTEQSTREVFQPQSKVRTTIYYYYRFRYQHSGINNVDHRQFSIFLERILTLFEKGCTCCYKQEHRH